MTELLFTLVGGVAGICLGFLVLVLFTPLNGKQAGLIMLIVSQAVYLPLAISFWPGADVVAIHVAIFAVTNYVLAIISSQYAKNRETAGHGKWFHWAPTALVIFFLVILVVDGIFIAVSKSGVGTELAKMIFPEPRSGGEVSSFFPGTVAHDYQKKEQQYNEYLARVREQKERGWQVKKGWLNLPKVGEKATFQVYVQDKQGRPVEDAVIHGAFMRPANSRLDLAFDMQDKGKGIYQFELQLSEPGTWDLWLKIEKDGAVHELKGTTSVN